MLLLYLGTIVIVRDTIHTRRNDGATNIAAPHNVHAVRSDEHDLDGDLLESKSTKTNVVHELRVPSRKP